MTIVRQIADTTEEQIKTAQKLVRRSWLATLGAAGIAMDTTEKTFNKCINRGEAATKSLKKDLTKLNQKLRREQAKLNEDVQDAEATAERKLTDVLAAINVPTRRDLRVLDTRINQLNAQLRELNGAVVAPLQNYDALTVEEVNALLPSLTVDQLYAIEQYELTHQRRVTILREVERQIAQHLTANGEISEPFAGYTELRVEDVVAKLDGLTLPELRHVKLYESTHTKRVTVLREVERRIEALLAPVA